MSSSWRDDEGVEGRSSGSSKRLFFMSGDLNVELGLRGTDVDEGMRKTYGPQC